MPLILRTSTRVNNETALPGSADSRIADRLAEIRLVCEKRAAFITAALSTSPRAHKHRHVRSAWMSRCKHLSCLSRPRRHSLVVHLSLSPSASVFLPRSWSPFVLIIIWHSALSPDRMFQVAHLPEAVKESLLKSVI